MGYIVCDKCQGYYELQPGEYPEDFDDTCECGGKLRYECLIEDDNDYVAFYQENRSKTRSPTISKNFKTLGLGVVAVLIIFVKFMPYLLNICLHFPFLRNYLFLGQSTIFYVLIPVAIFLSFISRRMFRFGRW